MNTKNIRAMIYSFLCILALFVAAKISLNSSDPVDAYDYDSPSIRTTPAAQLQDDILKAENELDAAESESEKLIARRNLESLMDRR